MIKKLKGFFKKEEEKKKLKVNKDFVLTPNIERSLLPMINLESRKASRMMELRKKDEVISELRKAIDEAEESIVKMADADADPDLLDELIQKAESGKQQELILMYGDKEFRDLDEQSKDIMLNPDFYKPIIKAAYVVTDEEIDNLSLIELEEAFAFFFFNMRAEKTNSPIF